MKHLIVLLLLLSTTYLFGQNNIIKGRVAALPYGAFLYSTGLGYERIFAGRFSVQVLGNLYGYNSHATDGNAINISNLVPEIRFYYGRAWRESIGKASFVGLFSEWAKSTDTPSGESYPLSTETTLRSINPGVLLGTCLKFKKGHFEIYCGLKYRFIEETRETQFGNGRVIVVFDYVRFGGRLGVNICFQL